MHVLTGDWTLKIKCREKCNSGELSKENTVGGHRYNGQPEWPNRLVTGQEQLKRVLYENAELTNCFRDWIVIIGAVFFVSFGMCPPSSVMLV